MTPKEFVEFVFNTQDPDVKDYVVATVGNEKYNQLEAMASEKTILEEDVSALENLCKLLPPEVAFHYFRKFYFNDKLRPVIDAQGDLLKQIADLRDMKVKGVN